MKVPDINSKNSFKWLFALIIVFYSILYTNYLIKDPILSRDDLLLILPLKSIYTFTDYINAVKNNYVLDFQPVRDLTFYINVKLNDLAGISTFHLFNFILFIFSIYLVRNLLRVLGFSVVSVLVSTTFYAAHPLMVSSVGWISARKHILALVFILLALIDVLKKKDITLKSILYYFLSILSHQIFILLPCWFWIYFAIKKNRIGLIKLAVMSVLGVLVLFVGVLKTFYLEMGNVTYKYFHWTENISRYVLSIGRSLIQIIFPYSISTDYYQGSILNLIGIPLLILGLFALYKGKNRQNAILWMLLAFLSHVLTCITFINDTYLYLPLICLLISLNYYFQENPLLRVRVREKYFILGLMLILLTMKTIGASQMWRSDKDLWQYSYKNEESPYTSIVLGSYLLKHNEELGLEFIVWGVNNYDLISNQNIFNFFIETIYKSNLSTQKKIKIFKDCYVDFDVYKAFYALTLLEGSETQLKDGVSLLKPLLKKINIYQTTQTKGMTIIEILKKICLKSNAQGQACFELGIEYQKE